MKNQYYLCRLPFNSGDGVTRFCVMGEMTTDLTEDFKVAVEAPEDVKKLPICADCSGELASGELVYGAGARKCMHCGSVYLVTDGVGNALYSLGEAEWEYGSGNMGQTP